MEVNKDDKGPVWSVHKKMYIITSHVMAVDLHDLSVHVQEGIIYIWTWALHDIQATRLVQSVLCTLEYYNTYVTHLTHWYDSLEHLSETLWYLIKKRK